MNAADERARGVREYVRVRRENEKLKAKLRAAEEVVRAMRTITEYPHGFRHQIREVLRKYDEGLQ